MEKVSSASHEPVAVRVEKAHTVILGAGPSGLAAAYTLARSGHKPVVIERSKFSGGLMRSIHHKGFIMDVGRKELYNRLEKVDSFWSGLLKDDYRPYPHRGGILFRGHIIDALPNYQGFRRGMSWMMFTKVGFDFLKWRIAPGAPARNLEEQFYRQRGQLLTQIFSQGFQEKLHGRKWSEVPIEAQANGSGAGLLSTVKGAVKRAFSKSEPNTFKGEWRHPAKGTGQICDLLEQGLTAGGGRIEYESSITGIETSRTGFDAITVKTKTETVRFVPEHVITSVPIEFLLTLLPGESVSAPGKPPVKNTVVLVYLFLDEPPRFPQTYLHVTCPTTQIGRITNYSAYNGDMVPQGKTCLCCELYYFDENVRQLSDQQISDRVLSDCAASGLVDPQRCSDRLVLRFPGADASQNKDNWINKERLKMMGRLAPYRNVYYTNRTELDLATLAGIEAAEAIQSGNRADFDRRSDPNELEIRSEEKAFAFT